MSFELPDLDTRDSAALQAELIRRIAQFSRLWTDFNASDPGITLLQLLCWISESLLYQNNAIPIQTQQNFLRQVLGLAYTSNITPYSQAAQTDYDFAFLKLREVLRQMESGQAFNRAQLQHAVLDFQAAPYLALSLEDVQTLALQTNQMIAAQQLALDGNAPTPLLVKRADAQVRDQGTRLNVLSDAVWAYAYPPYPNTGVPDARGGVRRVLLLSKATGAAALEAAKAEKALLDHVRSYLAPRVLLGNRVEVAASYLTQINLTVRVRCVPQAQVDIVLDAMLSALFAYFRPDQAWIYDQPPMLDQLQWIVEAVPGVAALDRLELNYAPTAQLPVYAQLGANFMVAELPPGPPAMLYRGLPQLRCLDLYARSTS